MKLYYQFLSLLFIILFYFKYCDNINSVYIEISAASKSYLIYLPLVVTAWKKLSYDTIVIIVYHNMSKLIKCISKSLQDIGSEVIHIKYNTSVSLHFASKLSRIYGFMGSKKVKQRDYLYISDADMIPLSKSFFHDFNYNKLTIKSFGPRGYGYGRNKGRWAMCYMVANKFIWNNIFKNETIGVNIEDATLNTLYKEIKKGEKYFESFLYIDEVFLRDRIKQWIGYKSHVLYHERNYNNTRIDRSKWPNNLTLIKMNDIIDAHLPKLPTTLNKLLTMWKEKIEPFQLYLFHKIIYDIDYINKIFTLI